MKFANREVDGRLLATKLAHLKSTDPRYGVERLVGPEPAHEVSGARYQ